MYCQYLCCPFFINTTMSLCKILKISRASVVTNLSDEHKLLIIESVRKSSIILQIGIGLKKESRNKAKCEFSKILAGTITDILEYNRESITSELMSSTMWDDDCSFDKVDCDVLETIYAELLGYLVGETEGGNVDGIIMWGKEGFVLALLECFFKLLVQVFAMWKGGVDNEKVASLIESSLNSLWDQFEDTSTSSSDYTDSLVSREDDLECIPYSNIWNVANNCIQNILIEAEENVYHNYPFNELPEVDITKHRKNWGAEMSWPKIEEFTMEEGRLKIYDYMRSFNFEEDWIYCINFLRAQSDICNDYYFYQAIWSLPREDFPVAQVTASLFFTIKVSRVIPRCCPVEVSYLYEGSSFVHYPGRPVFQEQWLFNILESKLELFKSVRF